MFCRLLKYDYTVDLKSIKVYQFCEISNMLGVSSQKVLFTKTLKNENIKVSLIEGSTEETKSKDTKTQLTPF